MDLEIAQRFTPYLAPQETVRWTGRPQQGLVLRASDAFMVPFSLLWCGFAIFWENMVVTTGAPWFFKLWGVPFVLVGLYIVFGRFLFDAFVRARTFYALTDHNALILSGMNGAKLTAVDLKTVQELHLKGGARGTIVFGPDYGAMSGMTWGRRYAAASPEFFAVEGADVAYGQIQKLRRGQ